MKELFVLKHKTMDCFLGGAGSFGQMTYSLEEAMKLTHKDWLKKLQSRILNYFDLIPYKELKLLQLLK